MRLIEGRLGLSRYGMLCVWLLLPAFLACGTAAPAAAETLPDALAEAATHNAAILAQQSRVQAVGEAIAIGEAGYFPTVSIAGSASLGALPNPGSGAVLDGLALDQRSLAYSVTVEQPIFDGFKTYHAVAAAKANAAAERNDLAGLTQNVLVEAVSAFVDVIRSRTIVHLREQNVANLDHELAATRQRSVKGDASEIDIQQTSARLADAADALAAADADGASAGARFQMVIGHPPGQLQAPKLPAAALPGSLTDAFALGQSANPGLLSALQREDAARHDIGNATSAVLPKVVLDAQYERTYVQAGRPLTNDQNFSIVGRVAVPLFDGGAALARVRQAKHLHAARLQMIAEQRAAVASTIAAAWAQLASARKRTTLNAKAVQAHRAALNGLRQARRGGQRTTLEVLDGERDLIEAEVRQQQSKRDLIVAGYTLLAVTGQLQAQ